MSDAEQATSSQSSVSAVAIKIPPFWANDPALWFSQVEAQFTLKGITSQLTKFHHIVASLEPEIALRVRHLILRPPATNPYNLLKTTLVQSFTPSDQSRFQQLLSTESLGDMKPSELYLRMQRLLGDSVVDESFLRNLFLLRLPVSIRSSLAALQDQPLSQLVQIADTLFEITPPSIAALPIPTQNQPTCESCPRLQRELEHVQSKLRELEIATKSQTPQRSPVRFRRSPSPHRRVSPSSTRQTLCWYHYKFGSNAVKCQPPCTFSSNYLARH